MAASGTKLSSVMRGMEAKKHEYLIVARTSASISLLTTSSIILTYLLSPRFRKPMNRLLFYASLGNIFQATALFICTSGLPFPGNTMSLCRFQAFCIQMFTTSAVFWTLSMALNVYLIYFRKFDTVQLRRLEPWYIAINYGWPFGHTFVMLMLDVSLQQTGIFGPAVMWCWISSDYEWMRLAFSYGPTWVIVLVVTAIFVVTGSRMVQQHYELTKLHQGPDAQMTLLESHDNERPYIPSNQIVRVTDIHLSSVIPEPDYSSSAVTREDFEHTESRERLEDEPDQDHSHQTEGSPSHDQYSSEKPDDEKPKHKQNQQHRPQRNANGSKPHLKLPPKVRLPPGVQVRLEDYSSSRNSNNPAARSPLQSFGSMLAQSRHSQLQSFGSLHVHGGSATWPCANAADDASPSPAKDDFVVHAGSARHTMATCTVSATAAGDASRKKKSTRWQKAWLGRDYARWKRRRDPRASHKLDAAWAYAKVAFLMFLGLIIIWVPASANRIYSLVHGVPSPLFTVMHAAVGPLQGFLHWIIYVATSWPQVRSIYREVRQSIRERLRRRQGVRT